jgi:cyclic pyranopterin phosphate synthase
MDQVVPRAELLARLEAGRGPLTPASDLGERGSAPAERWRLADGTLFGVIASTTTPFCGGCDRSRLTADGRWYLCLYAREGLDLRGPLRDGATVDELRAAIAATWGARADRGAEERLAASSRTALHSRAELQSDPRLEMHTRGG